MDTTKEALRTNHAPILPFIMPAFKLNSGTEKITVLAISSFTTVLCFNILDTTGHREHLLTVPKRLTTAAEKGRLTKKKTKEMSSYSYTNEYTEGCT